MSFNTLCNGCALGAGMMYFFDPVHGRRRRVAVETQVEQFLGDFGRGFDGAIRDVQGYAKGLADEVQSLVPSGKGNKNKTRLKDAEAEERREQDRMSPGMQLLLGAAGVAFAMHLTRRPGLVLSAMGLAALGTRIAQSNPPSEAGGQQRPRVAESPKQERSKGNAAAAR